MVMGEAGLPMEVVEVWKARIPWEMVMAARAGSTVVATREIWLDPVLMRLKALPAVERVAPVPRRSQRPVPPRVVLPVRVSLERAEVWAGPELMMAPALVRPAPWT